MNAYGTTTLSSPVTSNTFRLAMTSSNGWTVSGVSTALTVTSGGNFQVNQVGIYEVSMCLNAVGATPLLFGVGSLASDTAPSVQGPYLYQYAPMYTQDPTTIVTMPLNITDTSKYYYVDVIFPGSQATVGLSNVSTFVSLKPVGSYVSPSTNPWSQQGTSVTYSAGAVGIGGVNPSALTETFTVNGTTAFVGNVTVTSDASGSTYVLGKRVPAGSLDVSQYVTGSVPLTTTTSLINNYLSNAAQITANTSTGTITQALYVPATTGSFVNLGTNHSVNYSNLALSNLFVEAWVNISTTGVTRILAARTNGTTYDFTLQITSGNIVTFDVYNTAGSLFRASNATTLSAGTWYHVSGSYNRTGLTAGTVLCFVNGGVGGTTGTVSVAGPRVTPTANIYIAGDNNASVQSLAGNVADVRVMTKCIVPITTFSPQSAPFTTAPTYRTGMDTGYTSNLTLTLQTSYFPGASTSPYGPCLTLPGTVGSYYSAANSAYDTNWRTSGFCLEMWINYASFANATNGGTAQSSPLTWSHGPGGGTYDWGFGATNVGGLCLFLGGPSVANTAASVITAGSWNHIMVQGNGSNIYMAVNGTFQALNATYSPAGGNNTVAPTQPSVLAITSLNPIYVGSAVTLTPPNFAIAKARLTFGTSGSPSLGNVYSSGNFTSTLNPNFATVPAGATVAWSLDSQYPLPTYPSFFDVPVLPQQTPAYGAEPTPIGGVTSNTLSPYSTTYPQLDSIRFDGTGYIDYGNAASSVLTSNIWASPWTIEGWVYTSSFSTFQPILFRSQPGSGPGWYDLGVYINQTTGVVGLGYGRLDALSGGALLGSALALNTWTHIAVTYDGVRSNIYQGTSGTSSTVASNPVTSSFTTFNPTFPTHIGTWQTSSPLYLAGNLADLRVSNVARYTGSTYTVPNVADGSAPFATDSSTLLLLKSLGGQVGTTLEVQGRGLNAVSLGATQIVRAYPPAPMSSYLLDTTSNASVTYGQGKYVASASSEYLNVTYAAAWQAFNKVPHTGGATEWTSNSGYAAGAYIGSVVTVDTLGNAYAGEWIQLQNPASYILSSYSIQPSADSANSQSPVRWWVLGSRDGLNWTLLDSRSGITVWTNSGTQSFTASATQSYNYFRLVVNQVVSITLVSIAEWTLNGTEEGICVTNDSKVGVGIANPQRALEVAGDLIVGGTISGGSGLGGFRNRIINGDMRIAQRGTSFTAGGYTVDRWVLQKGILVATATQDSLAAGDSPATQSGLQYFYRLATLSQQIIPDWSYAAAQHVEGLNTVDLKWGTSYGSPVTVSFWYRSSVPGNHYFDISNNNFSLETHLYSVLFAVNTSAWQYYTFTIPPPPNGSSWVTTTAASLKITFMRRGNAVTNKFAADFAWQAVTGANYKTFLPAGNVVNFYGQPGSIDLTGVQIERGTVATPFEFRPFAQELALCQRYFQKSYSIATAPGTATESGNWAYYLPIAVGSTANWIQSGPVLQVSMRTAPAIVLYNSAGNVTTAWNALDGSTATAWRYLNNTSGGSLGPAFLGYGWTASAEL
jgi:hypothetical protein